MSAVLDLDSTIILLTWNAFGDLAEAFYLGPNQPSLDDNFKQHGCSYKHLGILPIFSKSLCQNCYTQYYYNYFAQEVNNPTACQEHYKPQPPELPQIPNCIHIFKSCYVEHALCFYFEMQLCLSQ
ncbi:hypothetical protein B0H10DRAFT_1953841 [Mycena sp. CBHHK59/15]|nr:hypothetical protein B0H10DRAFT_1953841 [Mycena sp. CBHHK59/15]